MNEAIKVLYIEDNPADVRLIQEMLSESPGEFDLESANRLSEGLKRLSTERYDIVLVDLGLPDSSGIESFNTLFTPDLRIPIIILSGLSDETLAVQAVKNGAQSYLLKDKINAYSLRDAIRYSIERCRLLVELRRNANELRERVKELNCLHEISKIVESDHAAVESILQSIVDTIPPAFLRPEHTVARITVGEAEFRSPNFRATKTALSEPISMSGEQIGRVDVHLLADGKKEDSRPFLNEERDLLRTISERIERIIERAQTEERLKSSEEKHRRLFETMAQGVVYQDKEGKITSANPAAEEILGLTLDQMMGRTSVDPQWRAIREDGSDFPGETHPTMVALKQGKEIKNQIMGVFNPSSEEYRWIDVSAVPLFGPGEKKPDRVYTTFTDITQLQQSRNHIHHLNRLLNSLRSINQLIVMEKDRDVLIQKVCEILVEISGYYFVWIGFLSEDRKEIVPVSTWGFEDGYLDAITVTWNDAKTAKGPSGMAAKTKKARVCNDLMNDPQFAPWRKEAKKRGYRSSIAVPIMHQDVMYGLLNVYADTPNYFYSDEVELLEEAAQDLGYAFFAIDIEERQKEIYEELKRSEERYRTTLDNMLEGCQIINPEWRYIYANENAARHSRRKKEDLLGKTMMEAYPGIEKTTLFRVLDECMESRSLRLLENEFTYPDGSTRWFELSILPVPEGLFILSNDITEQRQAEKELLQSQQRLVEAQHIARMGDFTWDVDTGEVSWSDGIYGILGYDKNEEIDYETVDQKIHHPDDLEEITQWLNDCVSSGKDELTPLEYRLIAKNGEVLYIRTVGEIIRGEDGSIKVFATIQDISNRKRAELALLESEELYRLLADYTLDVVWLMNLELEFTYVNPSIFQMTGYTQEEWIGSKLSDHCDKENFTHMAGVVAEEMAKGTNGEGAIFEADMLKKDREVVNVEIHGRVNFDDDNNPITIQGTTLDITERKRAEKALRESEEKYRNLFETSRDVIYRSSIDGDLLDINKMGEIISGYSRDELLGMNVTHAFNGNPERRLQFQKEVEKRGYIDDFEGVYRVKDGGIRYGLETAVATYDNEGNISGYQGIIRDITERKIAAEKLKESEEKWRSLFESSMDVVYVTSADGNIIDVNEAGEKLFGYMKEDFPNINALNIYQDPNDREKYKEAMKSQGYVKDYEISFKRKDGSPIECVVTANVRKDASGNILGYQGAVRDITEMKKMQQKLIQTEKLSSLGGILSGVAHELNNPLTAIIGFSELLARTDLPKDAIEKLNLIVDQSKRSSKIVKSLLTFAREHKPERKMIDVNSVIQDSYNLREYELRTNNISFRLDLEKELPETFADPYQLEQVFVNMINNTYHAMKDQDGGSLIIRSLQRDMKIVIYFIDDGPGIPKENLTKIFDPFFTTKEVGQGTGLGLSIVYGILEEHGGDVYVESRPGKGTIFVIELPIIERKEAPVEDKTKKPEKPDKSYSILVVEDEDSLRRFISDALVQEGYDTKTSRNGEEAVEMLDNNEFDAVISDIKMPGLSGQNLYTYIQKYHKDIENSVLFITGDVLGKDTRYFFQITGCKYLSKPFELDDLFVMLNEMLHQENQET